MEERLKIVILHTVGHILTMMSMEMKMELLNTNEKELAIFHFGFGTWIRSHILTENSEIFRIFIESGIKNRNDMSRLIIRELHRFLWN